MLILSLAVITLVHVLFKFEPSIISADAARSVARSLPCVPVLATNRHPEPPRLPSNHLQV